jgi:hypothetical protein
MWSHYFENSDETHPKSGKILKIKLIQKWKDFETHPRVERF